MDSVANADFVIRACAPALVLRIPDILPGCRSLLQSNELSRTLLYKKSVPLLPE